MKNIYLDFLSNKNQMEMLISQNVTKSKLFMSGTQSLKFIKKYLKIFQNQADNIKRKYGKFILITSRFAKVNTNKK